MYLKQATVINAAGIHARPASQFVDQAKRFKSRVTVRNVKNSPGGGVSAKSIIGVLSLGMTKGTVIEISAEGEDEQPAVDALVELVESGFGEKADL